VGKNPDMKEEEEEGMSSHRVVDGADGIEVVGRFWRNSAS